MAELDASLEWMQLLGGLDCAPFNQVQTHKTVPTAVMIDGKKLGYNIGVDITGCSQRLGIPHQDTDMDHSLLTLVLPKITYGPQETNSTN